MDSKSDRVSESDLHELEASIRLILTYDHFHDIRAAPAYRRNVRRVRLTFYSSCSENLNIQANSWLSYRTLASAVALPDPDTLRQSADYGPKRRMSSVSEYDSKRCRLSMQDNDISAHSQRRPPSSPAPVPDRPAERRPARQGAGDGAGRDEDRKRGQRLFGALLGTLSQSSNSVANKRRANIEKRQQDKLKSQAEEYDELKKQRRDRRDAIRKKEQPLYEREAVRWKENLHSGHVSDILTCRCGLGIPIWWLWHIL